MNAEQTISATSLPWFPETGTKVQSTEDEMWNQ